ncbi:YbaB/EbfC family nucleoid-associated protein [Saccharopolyspora sp. CA-218241]|uniref:YbaB/EbfC family nucleoid-associated protein n=1 Tax=Saccharopolyspora sp. CA-218241 TaxID=3240027 RepID=UPI003D9871F4
MGDVGDVDDEVRGSGAAAEGAVRAALDANGRLTGLELEPELLERGAPAVAEAVREAVTAAQDDLAERLRTDSGAMGAFEDQLDQLTAGFEKAIEKVTRDLADAQKRLEG